MNTLGERLEYLLESKALTPYAFEKITGYSAATMSRNIKKNQIPNEKNIELLCNYFNINRAWLLNGTPPMTGDSQVEEPNQPVLTNQNPGEMNELWKQLEFLREEIKEKNAEIKQLRQENNILKSGNLGEHIGDKTAIN